MFGGGIKTLKINYTVVSTSKKVSAWSGLGGRGKGVAHCPVTVPFPPYRFDCSYCGSAQNVFHSVQMQRETQPRLQRAHKPERPKRKTRSRIGKRNPTYKQTNHSVSTCLDSDIGSEPQLV